MNEAWKQWEGQVVDGEFRLRQYLGGCEHSAVFLAEREPEDQKVAIKLVLADRESADTQLRAWELAAKLSHPHLIRLFQMRRCRLGDKELVYLVMEYAEEQLAQVLAHRPLTSAEAGEMLEPVVEALAFVHGKGFAHGHLKPANILAVDDQLKVSSDGLGRTGQPSGGPWKPSAYDPPEIASEGMSPAGDVWSLGMTVVEALAQRLPSWEEREREEPVLQQTLPAPFLEIARHCLRRDPQRRWTVPEIRARLQQSPQALGGPTTARQKLHARWRYIAPAIILGLTLAVILLSHRAGQERHGASSALPPAAPLRSEAQVKTPGGSVPGKVVRQVLPDVPRKAQSTIRGKVRVSVRVRVDPSGSVAGAKLDSPGPSRYFAELALQAARDWKFTPAKIDGRDVSSEWVLRFEFLRTATRVLPVRAAP